MKKSVQYVLKFIFMAFCFYSAQALAFVDPPTFAPVAPNSTQAITTSVRLGVCHTFGVGAGAPPMRIERSPGVVDIYAPGVIAFPPFCNLSISTATFNIGTLPAGSYQVRIWIIDATFAYQQSTQVTSAPLTVAQGQNLEPVPTLSVGALALFIMVLLYLAYRFFPLKIGRHQLFLLSLLVGSYASAQVNEKTLTVLLSGAPGTPIPSMFVQPVIFSSGYLGALSQGFVAENPTRANYLLPRRAVGDFGARLNLNPNSERAKLERTIIVTYPSTANLQTALAALAIDSNVLYAAIPPKPVFATPPASSQVPIRQPANAKSGTNTGGGQQPWINELHFDRAWQLAGGYGLVAPLDNGLNVSHPDLIAFNGNSYVGGNFLPVYSTDAGLSIGPEPPQQIFDSNVDEREPVTATSPICDPDNNGLMVPAFAGHGSHTAGLIAANSTNSDGTVGACKRCGIASWRVANEICNNFSGVVEVAINIFGIIAAQTYTTDFGVQVVNQSFGFPTKAVDYCLEVPNDAWCLQITYANQRGVVMVASSGNARSAINFPAEDPRVVAVGGLEPDLSFWNDRLDLPPSALIGECPNLELLGQECGSNFTPTNPGERRQEITMPARDVYSTMYPGASWNQFLECGDATDGNANDGRGLCTGTSMSAPLYSGLAGLLRSINPLLLPGNPENAADAIGIRDVVVRAATVPGGAPWSPQFGYGIPDAEIAAKIMLGTVAGNTVKNRLTPLFSLYSVGATDWAYVTVPQAAVALINYTAASYAPRGTLTFGYNGFPESTTAVPAIAIPLASTFVLTTEFKANVSHPNTVPLYWLDRSRSFPVGCTTGSGCNLRNRDFLLVTSVAELEIAKADGYDFRGLQGYVYDRCAPAPACVPRGAEKLYRQCKVTEDDCAIFLESERIVRESEGYVSVYPVGSNMHIGYAYPNIDSDADNLIDGLEYIIGTNPTRADSDGDGLSDAAEFPLAGVSVSDPCLGPNIQCGADGLFANGFE